jgi:hypothetical protein
MVALPTFPSDVAVTVVVPDATPVTIPLCVTEAMAGALLDQLIVLPVSREPDADLRVATSGELPPTAIVATLGLTSMDATAAGWGLVLSLPPAHES